MRRSRSGSFFSMGEPGSRARIGELWDHKERGWLQYSGKESAHPPPEGKGSISGNVESILRFAHFTIEGGVGLPVPATPAPRKGLREKAKGRGQRREGAMLQPKHFSHRGFNADSNHVHRPG